MVRILNKLTICLFNSIAGLVKQSPAHWTLLMFQLQALLILVLPLTNELEYMVDWLDCLVY